MTNLGQKPQGNILDSRRYFFFCPLVSLAYLLAFDTHSRLCYNRLARLVTGIPLGEEGLLLQALFLFLLTFPASRAIIEAEVPPFSSRWGLVAGQAPTILSLSA